MRVQTRHPHPYIKNSSGHKVWKSRGIQSGLPLQELRAMVDIEFPASRALIMKCPGSSETWLEGSRAPEQFCTCLGQASGSSKDHGMAAFV